MLETFDIGLKYTAQTLKGQKLEIKFRWKDTTCVQAVFLTKISQFMKAPDGTLINFKLGSESIMSFLLLILTFSEKVPACDLLLSKTN